MAFGMFSMMFTIVFILVIAVFIINIVKGLGQWHKNNESPELTVEAKVVAKRTNITHHHHGGEVHHHHTSTSYYVTFEVPSGDRMEFGVNGSEYGLLVEGDLGALTFQGTRYLRFDRY